MQPAPFQLAAQDLIDANRLHLRDSLTSRRGILSLGGLSLVGILVFGALLWGEPDGWQVILIFAVVIPLVAWGTPIAIVYLLGPSGARRTMKQQKGLQLPVTLRWTDDEIQMESSQGGARIRWADFHKLRRNDRIFLFFESERLYRIVPKRVLAAAELADLERIVTAEQRRRSEG